MRIFHVVATGNRRGAEIFASDLVRALGEAGVSQHVAVLRGSDGTAVPYEAPTSLLDGDRGRVPGVRLGLGAARSLRTLIAGWAPDLVQAHGGESLKYGVAASLGLGVPLVYRRIGSGHDRISGGWRRPGYSFLVNRARLVISVADAVGRETIALFRLPPSRVVTIPNGVDRRRLIPAKTREETRRALGIPADSCVVLSVGALTWEKDPLALIDVASLVLRETRSAIHVIVGGGPLRTEVETAIRERGLGGRVLLLYPRNDLADLLAASDVLMLTSRTEGMPGIVIEAGMMGIPVVAYGIAGIPEVVVEAETGFLLPPGHPEGLASSVLRLVENGDLRRSMGEHARRRCISRFDIALIARRYLEEYGRLLGAPKPAALH